MTLSSENKNEKKLEHVIRHAWFWLLAATFFIALMYLFRGILSPFIVGIVMAYFLDPLVDKVERRGLGRTVSTFVVLGLFLAFIILTGFLTAPLLQQQFVAFADALPGYIEKSRSALEPWMEKLRSKLSATSAQNMQNEAGQYTSAAFAWVTGALRKLWDSGVAVIDILSFLFITPIVAFYMLRDWDRMLATIDRHLPLARAETIRAIARDVDAALSGFLRGQALVCLCLGAFYACALSLYGLNYGFFIGFAAGVLTFMPYVGTLVGLVAGLLVAYFQFDGNIVNIGAVAGIFAIGQFVEGNILTPRLVGDRVGLHALWIIFALMAGGELMGFTGVLIAVPVAAMVGVLLRFVLSQYRQSAYYQTQNEKT